MKPVIGMTAAAKAAGVAPQTVRRWCDSGALESYRIPGSTHRRIYRDSLAAFLRDHGMRVPAWLVATEAEPQ